MREMVDIADRLYGESGTDSEKLFILLVDVGLAYKAALVAEGVHDPNGTILSGIGDHLTM
jgi:hypothetical protein